ncbi:glutamic acid-rich protein-like isoform X2 [Teleopsis dalmanni]|uniref:glutamic acid-rich protein-like isoform X2 n=1 Tax=Teleopsis dalmanni TaxID=139649 RepID=UPI0018CE6B28|nr:glutamic acid-rich protein-like isoform X2 [Teleopsis dalmanni]
MHSCSNAFIWHYKMVKRYRTFEKQNNNNKDQNKQENEESKITVNHQYDQGTYNFTQYCASSAEPSSSRRTEESIYRAEKSSENINQKENLFNRFSLETDSQFQENPKSNKNKQDFITINRNEFLFGGRSNRLAGGSQDDKKPYFVLNIFGAAPLPLYYDPEQYEDNACAIVDNNLTIKNDVSENVPELNKSVLQIKSRLLTNSGENNCEKQLQKQINDNTTPKSKEENKLPDVKQRKTKNQELESQLKKESGQKKQINDGGSKKSKGKSKKEMKLNMVSEKESQNQLEAEIYKKMRKDARHLTETEVYAPTVQQNNCQLKNGSKSKWTDTEKKIKNTKENTTIKKHQDIFISIKDNNAKKIPPNYPVQNIMQYCQKKNNNGRKQNDKIGRQKREDKVPRHLTQCLKCHQNSLKNNELQIKKKKMKKIGYFKPIFGEKQRKQIKKINVPKHKTKESRNSVKLQKSYTAFFDNKKQKRKEEKLVKKEKKKSKIGFNELRNGKGKIIRNERTKKKPALPNFRIKPKEPETTTEYLHILNIKDDNLQKKKPTIERNNNFKEKCTQDDKIPKYTNNFSNVLESEKEKTDEVSNTAPSKQEIEKRVIEAIRRRKKEKKDQKKLTESYKKTQQSVVSENIQIRRELTKLLKHKTKMQKKNMEGNVNEEENEGQKEKNDKVEDLLEDTLKKAKKLKKEAKKSIKLNSGGNPRSVKLLQERKIISAKNELKESVKKLSRERKLAIIEKSKEVFFLDAPSTSCRETIRHNLGKGINFPTSSTFREAIRKNFVQESDANEQVEENQIDDQKSVDTTQLKKQTCNNNKESLTKEVTYVKTYNKSDTNKRLIRKKNRN